jgi:hypothetical protein
MQLKELENRLRLLELSQPRPGRERDDSELSILIENI